GNAAEPATLSRIFPFAARGLCQRLRHARHDHALYGTGTRRYLVAGRKRDLPDRARELTGNDALPDVCEHSTGYRLVAANLGAEAFGQQLTARSAPHPKHRVEH